MSPFTIAAVILFIGVLVFVHELGHFVVAKWFDIKVTKFSLGFGPPVLSFTRGETTYQIAAVPLGGYVRMVGEVPGETLPPEDRARSFTGAPIYQRALVALAGPAANLAFPIVCFFAYHLLEPEVQPPVVGEVEPGQPGDLAGLVPGDRILSANGERTWSFPRLVQVISAKPDQPIPLEVQRGDAKLSMEVTPRPVVDEDVFGKPRARGMISVSNVADGTRIGIDRPERLPPGSGLKTGDRVVAVDGVAVHRGEELGPALAAAAGRRVTVAVVRPQPVAAGSLVRADLPEALELSLDIPPHVNRIEDLGLALGASFVRSVVPSAAAARAGFRPGDRVLEVDGQPVRHFWRFLTVVKDAGERGVPVRIRRHGEELVLHLAADPVECVHAVTRKTAVVFDSGFGAGERPGPSVECADLVRPDAHWGLSVPPELEPARLSVDEALMESTRLTGHVIGLLVTHLFKMFVTQEVSTDTVGGPIQFMSVAAKAAEAGALAYLQMLAFISINLGVFNLLPVPVLDGGQLLLCLVEAVKRRPLSVAARERAAMVGLVLLGLLLLLALKNDIRSLRFF